jgi:hypothetical protein
MHVNVVPGDGAAGRLRDPMVRTELVYWTSLNVLSSIADSSSAKCHGGAWSRH